MKSIVINFHRIDESDWFERTIRSLRRKYRLLTTAELEEVLQSPKLPRGLCHITFDDGDRSFYQRAFPILQKYEVPVSHFISPAVIRSGENFWFQEAEQYDPDKMRGLIARELKLPEEKLRGLHFGNIFKSLPIDSIHKLLEIYRQETGTARRDRQNMTTEEVLITETSGLVTYGAHTQRHPILANESDADAEMEITQSVTELETLLDHPVRYFAYPNGFPEADFGKREVEILKQSGIHMAFSTEPRHIRSGDSLYRVPRMGLSPNNPINALKLRLGARWETVRSLIGATSPIAQREKMRELLALHT